MTRIEPDQAGRLDERTRGPRSLVAVLLLVAFVGSSTVAWPLLAGPGTEAGTDHAELQALPPVVDMTPYRERFASPAPLPARPDGAPGAPYPAVPGRLALENGCVVASSEAGRHVVLWPAGTTAVLEDGLVTITAADGRRVARLGDSIQVSSAPHAAGSGIEGAGPCRVSPRTPAVDAQV